MSLIYQKNLSVATPNFSQILIFCKGCAPVADYATTGTAKKMLWRTACTLRQFLLIFFINSTTRTRKFTCEFIEIYPAPHQVEEPNLFDIS